MHVLISALSRFVSPTGICRHAANIAFALESRSEIQRISFVTGTWQEQYYRRAFKLTSGDKIQVIPVAIPNNSFDRNWWFMRTLPRLSKAISADIVHLSFPVPIGPRWWPCKTVVTLHDLYPYDFTRNLGLPRALISRRLLRSAIANADAIACVSQTTLCRMRELFPQAWHKAVKIFNVVQPWREPARAPESVQFEDFILAVAQHRQNKNLLLGIEGFAQLRQQKIVSESCGLVIVGSPGPETGPLKRVIARLQLQDSVQMLSTIPESEMRWLYENCSLFVATSSLEGFCLPLVEAMLTGCPIVCSDIPIFREIGSPQCAYFDLTRPCMPALVSAAKQVYSRAHRHHAKAADFSPAAVGQQYSALYRRVLDGPIKETCGHVTDVAAM